MKFDKFMQQLGEIHLSSLTNPGNNLKYSIYQFLQYHLKT